MSKILVHNLTGIVMTLKKHIRPTIHPSNPEEDEIGEAQPKIYCEVWTSVESPYMGRDADQNTNQAEQPTKRKNATTNQSKPAWSQPAQRSLDKGKSIEVENQLKKNQADSSKTNKPDQGKPYVPNKRTRDVTCFKCQGKGHYARDCPNECVLVLKADGEHESQDEAEIGTVVSDDEVTNYPEAGELLVT
ncbi:hypothetical protein N665_0101s0014 [Sinapis alba]|nr:hypothetical protein N665_0101s0014 [Sinapis alba]